MRDFDELLRREIKIIAAQKKDHETEKNSDGIENQQNQEIGQKENRP